ncbi:DNA primase [Erysipelothrix sp. HDW6A]|nr:DNA primase [Erysipelothrix sp. HDW6A]
MRRMPEDVINDVRSKVDIVDTISQYMTLTRKGKNYLGICPFHDDHDPSMSVSPDRQIYKCFVCGAGGNVFSFIQNFEKIGFIDAVIKAASTVNIDLSEYESTQTRPVDTHTQRLLEAMAEAEQFTSYQLFSRDGKEALDKLEGRGYSQDLIRQFRLGVAGGNNQLANYLLAKGFTQEELIEADLVRMSDDGIRDVFYNRIMFPIMNPFGKVIAFSARALSDSNSVKYINTSETPIYTKGRTLYNFHIAKDQARSMEFVVVCEGVTDVIAMTKAGMPNTVATLGVACTDEQIRLLKQCSSNVVLAYDGDRAGIEATYAIGKRLKESQCNVSVWYNDSGLDPDDAVRKLGGDTVKQGIEDRIHWLDFIISYAVGNYGTESFEKNKRVAEFVIDHLKTEDELTQSYYLKRVADVTKLDMAVLNTVLSKQTERRQMPVSTKTIVEIPKRHDVSIPEQAILKQMLNSKEAAYVFRDQLGFLISDLATNLALVILDVYRTENSIQFADILSLDIHDSMRQLVIEIDLSDIAGEYDKDSLSENIEIVRRELVRMGILSLKNEGSHQQQLDEKIRLLNEAIQQKRNTLK